MEYIDLEHLCWTSHSDLFSLKFFWISGIFKVSESEDFLAWAEINLHSKLNSAMAY